MLSEERSVAAIRFPLLLIVALLAAITSANAVEKTPADAPEERKFSDLIQQVDVGSDAVAGQWRKSEEGLNGPALGFAVVYRRGRSGGF
jgi:hypothetical protein